MSFITHNTNINRCQSVQSYSKKPGKVSLDLNAITGYREMSVADAEQLIRLLELAISDAELGQPEEPEPYVFENVYVEDYLNIKALPIGTVMRAVGNGALSYVRQQGGRWGMAGSSLGGSRGIYDDSIMAHCGGYVVTYIPGGF